MGAAETKLEYASAIRKTLLLASCIRQPKWFTHRYEGRPGTNREVASGKELLRSVRSPASVASSASGRIQLLKPLLSAGRRRLDVWYYVCVHSP